MKRIYEKPVVLVENFALSENIASCNPIFSNGMDIDELISEVNGFTGYFTEAQDCNKIPEVGFEYTTSSGQKLCYHTSSAVVFSS